MSRRNVVVSHSAVKVRGLASVSDFMKLIFVQLVKKFRACFVEPKGKVQCFLHRSPRPGPVKHNVKATTFYIFRYYEYTSDCNLKRK